jgi:NMD protein affecting ribosome stability and mRNA decay
MTAYGDIYMVYYDTICQIRLEHISHDEKWEKKFKLTKQFIDEHKRFPHDYYKILNCKSDGSTKYVYRQTFELPQ